MFSDPVTWYASRARYEEPARCGRTKIVAKIREEGSERMAGYFSVSPAETFFARIYRRVKSNLARLRYPRVYIYTCWSATPAVRLRSFKTRTSTSSLLSRSLFTGSGSFFDRGRAGKKTKNREVRSPYTVCFSVSG